MRAFSRPSFGEPAAMFRRELTEIDEAGLGGDAGQRIRGRRQMQDLSRVVEAAFDEIGAGRTAVCIQP